MAWLVTGEEAAGIERLFGGGDGAVDDGAGDELVAGGEEVAEVFLGEDLRAQGAAFFFEEGWSDAEAIGGGYGEAGPGGGG